MITYEQLRDKYYTVAREYDDLTPELCLAMDDKPLFMKLAAKQRRLKCRLDILVELMREVE